VAHPGISAVLRRKESAQLDRYTDGPINDEQVHAYHRFFPRAPGTVAGEWTPRYMALPALPRIISRVAPEARLLAIVRDPVERYRSGLGAMKRGRFAGLVRRGDRKQRREALIRGFYGRQVQRLMDVVGAERFLVLQYERCVAQPRAELARTVAYLGLPPFEPPAEALVTRFNPTTQEKLGLSEPQRRELVLAYAPEVARLKRLVPDLDLTLWPDFADVGAA
jgi:hypothetical protein